MENTLKVFVLNMRGQPLMPCSPPKARKLLRAGKAVPVRRTPFVIQLTVPTGETKQPSERYKDFCRYFVQETFAS